MRPDQGEKRPIRPLAGAKDPVLNMETAKKRMKNGLSNSMIEFGRVQVAIEAMGCSPAILSQLLNKVSLVLARRLFLKPLVVLVPNPVFGDIILCCSVSNEDLVGQSSGQGLVGVVSAAPQSM